MGARILVVDDNPEACEQYHAALSSHGYEAIAACDGARGLRALRELTPDLVLVCLELPDLAGWHMLRGARVLCDDRAVPAIVVSSCPLTEYVVNSWQLGMAAQITRPFPMSELLSLVARLLEQCPRALAAPPQ